MLAIAFKRVSALASLKMAKSLQNSELLFITCVCICVVEMLK